MDDQVLMRVLHGRADVGEEAQPRADVELAARSQYVVIGTPSTYSITRYGRPSLGDAAVEQPRDVRMDEAGEDLALGEEPLMQRIVGVAGADQLDGDALLEVAVRRARRDRPRPCRRGRSPTRCGRRRRDAEPPVRAPGRPRRAAAPSASMMPGRLVGDEQRAHLRRPGRDRPGPAPRGRPRAPRVGLAARAAANKSCSCRQRSRVHGHAGRRTDRRPARSPRRARGAARRARTSSRG